MQGTSIAELWEKNHRGYASPMEMEEAYRFDPVLEKYVHGDRGSAYLDEKGIKFMFTKPGTDIEPERENSHGRLHENNVSENNVRRPVNSAGETRERVFAKRVGAPGNEEGNGYISGEIHYRFNPKTGEWVIDAGEIEEIRKIQRKYGVRFPIG
jgi:hypothetical protein